MADSSSRISFDVSSLRCVSSSLFNIPGFVMGFTKGLSSNGESTKSPTSTLDFGPFSISSPFSVSCTRTSCQSGNKLWNHFGVGLDIVNSPVEETGSLERKNVLCGLEVKAGFLRRKLEPQCLPKNYVISSYSETDSSKLEFINLDSLSDDERVTSGSKSLTSLSESKTCLSSSSRKDEIGVQNKATLTSRGLAIDCPLKLVQSSVPLPIECSRQYARSLSARDIVLSEDYTCIISHGPNPKTTDIFGDYILDCHANELSFANEKDQPESMTEPPNILMLSGGSLSYPSDRVLNFCYSCMEENRGGHT